EADSKLWGTRREWTELGFADGRLYYSWQRGRLTDVHGPGAACVKTDCLEPFVRWNLSYHGYANTTSGTTMANERVPDVTFIQTPIKLDAELTMCAPPWQQGTLLKATGDSEARDKFEKKAESFMGGTRYEQLQCVSGTLTVEGETINFTGTGVRTHRIGRRDLTNMIGHTWHTATFASGRAFGYHRFTDPEDTSRANYNEAFMQDENSRRYPATVVRAPIDLDKPVFSGQKYEIVLESELGRAVIQSETRAIGHVTTVTDGVGHHRVAFGVDRSNPEHHVLNHGIVHHVWNGEIGYGMLERSVRAKRLG
ncbi:MAG: hypothetical protein ABW049_14175, partial [Spongiibacteraceae bacterium]